MTRTIVAKPHPRDTLSRRFPTMAAVDSAAKRRMPRFGFDYWEGGTGFELAVARNRKAFEAIEIVPRYGVAVETVSLDTTLFGRSYAAPIGVAPVGLGGGMWPGAEEILAKAAQKARIPFTLSTMATRSIEKIAALAPDVFWFQLYAFSPGTPDISADLVRRADAAGAHALVVTMDVPTRARRPRDMRNGLTVPVRFGPSVLADVALRPAWALAALRRGVPMFENLTAYVDRPRQTLRLTESRPFIAFTWEAIARLRDLWPRALVLKGLQHPEDAERALALGVDGIQVSNHGGRQLDAGVAAIDSLPEIAGVVGDKATLLYDSGIRCGEDVLRSLALGARCAFAGRPFYAAVAALGDAGGDHLIHMLMDELSIACGQSGLTSTAAAGDLTLRRR